MIFSLSLAPPEHSNESPFSTSHLLILVHRVYRPAQTKNPAFRRKTGLLSKPIFTALHRRPIVKRIQAGFLAYGSSYPSPLPVLLPSTTAQLSSHRSLRISDSGYGKSRPRLQRRGRPRFSRGSPCNSQPPEYE
jgi:hypothetical protein